MKDIYERHHDSTPKAVVMYSQTTYLRYLLKRLTEPRDYPVSELATMNNHEQSHF